MDEQLLSSEEIRELTKGEDVQITKEEIDALGEIGNISIGTSATTLYSLLRNKVVITTPKVSITNIKKIKDAHPIPFISVEVFYTKGLSGSNIMIIKERDAKIIADLMMGGDGSNIEEELDDIKMSAIGEAMNQMMGSAATSLSTILKQDINISPPRLTRINLATDTMESFFSPHEDIVNISFSMEIGNFLKSEIMQLMPISFAKKLVEQLLAISNNEIAEEKNEEENFKGKTDEKIEKGMIKSESVQTSNAKVVEKYSTPKSASKAAAYDEKKKSQITPDEKGGKVKVNPVEFQNLTEEPAQNQSSSLDLILDVPLEVTVELGRTTKTIKEILDISIGTIIELEKMAGEPIDILVNGKPVAKGEVVVIDENFGVRITEIIDPYDRVKSLQ